MRRTLAGGGSHVFVLLPAFSFTAYFVMPLVFFQGQQRAGTLVQALPGFSGFNDGTKEPGYARLQRRHEDSSDLFARAARMKSEKLEIRERTLALRTSLHQVKIIYQCRRSKPFKWPYGRSCAPVASTGSPPL